MGKRKRGAPQKAAERPSEYEDREAGKFRLDSLQDVADSEDEFHAHRDKILLEDQPQVKKARKQREEDAFLEPSDEGILGYSTSSSEGDDEDIEVQEDAQSTAANDDSYAASAVSDEDNESLTNWGGSKSAYYNTDAITTEQEALDEETEARRLQQKRLQGLSEADFGFDEDTWAGQDAEEDRDNEDGEGSVIFEKLPQLQISSDTGPEERLAILKKRYPELEGYASDLVALQPTWEALKAEIRDAEHTTEVLHSNGQTASLTLTRFRALSAYLGGLSMYFAVLTSPAQGSMTDEQSNTTALPTAMPPTELRDHGILDAVKQCQTTWYQVRDLQDIGLPSPEGSDEDDAMSETEDIPARKQHSAFEASGAHHATSHPTPPSTAQAASEARRAARLARTEASLARLPSTIASNNSHIPTASARHAIPNERYIGDEAPPSSHLSNAKANKRRSLRFYTSQIAQKASKREGAKARALAGDEDLPYQERWRDRVQRLNREAAAKGSSGRDLGGDDEIDDVERDGGDMTNVDRELEGQGVDDDYMSLTAAAVAKKEAKAARRAAGLAAADAPRTSSAHSAAKIGLDGRREIGYQISANKGLTPKRKKENKNPRVKKRRRYEDKTKKLRSMKPTFKSGGEGRGGYGGELTGIKTGVVRGVKF